jgi:hypothetical protein
VVQAPLMRWARGHARDPVAWEAGTHAPPLANLLFQFLVAVYGGYFGAGGGIPMLAAFGLMGMTNIHQMNGLKNWCGLHTNFVAVIVFAASGIIDWPVALTMTLGAIAGGWVGSHYAQRAGQRWVRRAIVVIGLATGGAMFWKAP